MNYANIKWYDVANGPGVRVSLFVSGCRNHCKNCFNPETWDFDYGQPFTEEVEDKILKAMEPDYIKGFTLLRSVRARKLRRARSVYEKDAQALSRKVRLVLYGLRLREGPFNGQKRRCGNSAETSAHARRSGRRQVCGGTERSQPAVQGFVESAYYFG